MKGQAEVIKVHHCVWPIHSHIVFPVKDRKALFDQDAVAMIRATAIGIQERYGIVIERMGMENDDSVYCAGRIPILPQVGSIGSLRRPLISYTGPL